MPLVAGRVVNALTSGSGLLDIWVYVVVALLLMVLTLILSSFLQFEAWHQNSGYAQALIMAMYGKLLDSDTNDTQYNKQSDMQVRFSNDVGVLANLWPTGYVIAARQVLTILVAAVVLLYLSWELALCIAVFFPIAVYIFNHFSKHLAFFAQSARLGLASTNGVLLESLAAQGIATASGTDVYHKDRLRSSLKATQGKIQQAQRYSIKMGVALGLLPITITGIIWLIGGLQVQRSTLTTGDLAAFALVLSILYAPIHGLFTTTSAVIFEGAALSRITEILDMPTCRYSNLDSLNGKDCDGPASIALQNLSYSREGVVLFQNFSLNIPAASFVVIKGANGVGKTTLLSIMHGVYPAYSDKVLVNGKPLSEHNLSRTLAISFLPQDIMLFNDSVRNNIIMGRNIPDDEIWELARDLELENFFKSWADEMDAQVGEGGHNLSGGERQRIGLMRALIGKPAILLMDEPEQNLDETSLNNLLKYVEKIKRKVTLILVTHSNAFNHLVDEFIDLSILRKQV